MLVQSPFDIAAAAARRLTEPDFRRFPSLWDTLPAHKAGFLDSLVQLQTSERGAISKAIASAALEDLFAKHQPQSLYPYVWVRNALNPVPDANGHHAWLHEVLVSYERDDMPDDAPLQFEMGQLTVANTEGLKFGLSPRHGAHGVDLVRQFCAYAHVGPAQRAAIAANQDDQHAPEHELEAAPSL